MDSRRTKTRNLLIFTTNKLYSFQSELQMCCLMEHDVSEKLLFGLSVCF